MLIRVTRTKMAMDGDFYAYDAHAVEKPAIWDKLWRASCVSSSEGGRCYYLMDSFSPVPYDSLPACSTLRYWTVKAAEYEGEVMREAAIWKAFPETRGRKVSTLWQEGPAGLDHASVVVEMV